MKKQTWESTGTYGVSEERNSENHKKEVEAKYIFTTSKEEYHVAIYACLKDRVNPDNVGLYSFCIFNKKENPNPNYPYWGGAERGINIAK